MVNPRGLPFRIGMAWECFVFRTARGPGGKASALPKLPGNLPPLSYGRDPDLPKTPGGFILPKEARNAQIILGDSEKSRKTVSAEPVAFQGPRASLFFVCIIIH